VTALFFTSASGWIACVLIGCGALLPYLLRRGRLSAALGMARNFAQPYLQRMWPHYWLGYVALALSFAHAWVPMQAGHVKRADAAGLWLATAALGLLIAQGALGLMLQDARLQERAKIRGWHYWMMVGVVATVAMHIWLNG
jgi:hypothetical protein